MAFHPFPVGTDIAVRNPIIGHVFPVADGILERPLFLTFVGLWLNVGSHVVFLEIFVIFFAFVSCIGHYLSVVGSQMAPHIFKERYRRLHIGGPGAFIRPHHIFRIHSKLDVVARLQLLIQHGIFFHPHESGIVVRLCIAVAVSTDVQFCFVILQPGDIPLELFHSLLQRGLPLAGTVDEDSV